MRGRSFVIALPVAQQRQSLIELIVRIRSMLMADAVNDCTVSGIPSSRIFRQPLMRCINIKQGGMRGSVHIFWAGRDAARYCARDTDQSLLPLDIQKLSLRRLNECCVRGHAPIAFCLPLFRNPICEIAAKKLLGLAIPDFHNVH